MSNEENKDEFIHRLKGFNIELKTLMDKYEVGFTTIPTVASSKSHHEEAQTQIKIVTPPKEVFRENSAEMSRALGQQTLFCYERHELSPENGIVLWFRDVPYPSKGFPFTDAIKAIGLVKRATTIIIKNISIFKLRTKARRQDAFHHYCVMGDTALAGFYLKDEYLCPFAREAKKFLTIFLTELGYNPLFADIVAFFIQYDDNYRYRLQDIISETDSETIKRHLFKEIDRLFKLSFDRDLSDRNKIISKKFKMCVRLLKIGLRLPKVRKAFFKALEEINFDRMKFDEADQYHCLLRGDYDYFGETIETRREVFDKVTPITPKQLIF